MAYVDAQRNVAVSYGERDVKADVTAKNKRERTVASNVEEGDTADAFLAQVSSVSRFETAFLQGETELKRGRAVGSLAYLNKAVELNDYDESALVARSRCHHQLGRQELRNA